MIKRTGEKVLTWIGFILHTLYVIFLYSTTFVEKLNF